MERLLFMFKNRPNETNNQVISKDWQMNSATENSSHAHLAEIIANQRPSKVLDIPSGPGKLAQSLQRRGVQSITCMDILEACQVEPSLGARYIRADINDPLPFEDGSFDCVVSREGIEHLVTPFAFLGELCRVLKPGGVLFLTTPNIMAVDARMKYLLSGYFQGFRELRDNHHGLRQLKFQGHISPIYFWQLAYFLGNYGFTVERVTTNEIKQEKKPLKRLFACVIASLIRANARRRSFPDGGTLSDEFLFGDSLIVQARRTGKRVTCHGRVF